MLKKTISAIALAGFLMLGTCLFTGCAGGSEKAAGTDSAATSTESVAPAPAPSTEDTTQDSASTRPVVPPNKP